MAFAIAVDDRDAAAEARIYLYMIKTNGLATWNYHINQTVAFAAISVALSNLDADPMTPA